MNKNNLNIIKAVFLIIIIGLLSIISILQTTNKNNIGNAITPQQPTPTYKNPTKSNNKNIEFFNTIAGSNQESLHQVVIKDNYYVIGTTESYDGDFFSNTSFSVFVSKVNQSGTILKTITIPCQAYYDCINYRNHIILSIFNTYNYIVYINYDLGHTIQKVTETYNSLFICENDLFGFCEQSGFLYNLQSNIYYNTGYNNYILDNIIFYNQNLILFLRQDSYVVMQISQNSQYIIVELEDIVFVTSQYLKDCCFVSVLVEDNLIINKISYDGNINFCYDGVFKNINFVYILEKANGYDIYVSSNDITIKLFLCSHGDEIYREVLDLKNIKHITTYDKYLFIVGTTQLNNTIIKTEANNYIINGGEIENIYFDNSLNILFCQSQANALDLLSQGLSDIYIFKLNIEQ